MTAYQPFRSATARERYLKIYAIRAGKWSVASQTRYVETSYGQTFVRISGPKGAPPLVLLHGGGGDSLQWIPNIEALARRYRVYAVDNIYDYSRSIYSRIPKNPDDYVNWLDEVFTALEPRNNIKLVGLSYGAWLTSRYAIRFPGRLDKIVLLAPGGTVLPIRKEWIVRAVLCFLPLRYFTRNFLFWLLEDFAHKDEASRVILEEEVDLVVERMKCYKPIRPLPPTVLTDAELENILVPTLYLVGENEKICSARQAIKRLHKVAPQIKTEVIPDAGHDVSMVQAEIVNTKILEFLK